MKKILITGGNGQLGHCFQKISKKFENKYQFIFTDYDTLDITNQEEIKKIFWQEEPIVCINASAYTAVDLAETEVEKAFAVNADGVENLAEICKEYKTQFVHISTDYVFDGDTNLYYTEEDFTNPISVYGTSKLAGEELALEKNPKTIIVRTSWLYSEFGKNFVKTMMSLFETKDELNIVSDQFGQPTNANDLAEAIMKIVETKDKTFGVFHFSNAPETNWYEFAKKIAEFSHSKIKLNAITTEQYPTPAKRPKRSTFSLEKIEKSYNVKIKDWQDSLENCIKILKS